MPSREVGTASLRVIAHHPRRTSVELWIEARGHGTDWRVEVAGDDGARRTWTPDPPPDHELAPVLIGEPVIRVWVWQLRDLEPGTEYAVTVVDANGSDDSAQFRTLPTALDEHRPFTVLAASCYSVENDAAAPTGAGGRSWSGLRYVLPRLWNATARNIGTAVAVVRHEGATTSSTGLVGHRYEQMWRGGDEPDLKLLLGDQVYLDTLARSLLVPAGERAVRRHISRVYHRTWDSLGPFLRLGANVCISDDHEFWNNYPRTPFWPGLWPRTSRERAWRPIAQHYLRAMQRARPASSFDIGEPGRRPHLSFFLADTRIHRDGAGGRFMADADFDELREWVENLRSPGVLGLGQPVITGPGSGRDAKLADFAQYAELCRVLSGARHDIVVLAGDVHFGRLASVEIGHAGFTTRIHEVVSSPTSLVSFAGGWFEPAGRPEIAEFPRRWRDDLCYLAPGAVPGPVDVRALVRTRGRWRFRRCVDHYMTLRFTRVAGSDDIEVEVRAHLLTADAAPGPPTIDPGITRGTLRLRADPASAGQDRRS